MADKNVEDVRQIMLETAKLQFAALNAGIVFWSGWVESASGAAKAIGEQLAQLGREGVDSNEVLGKVTDLNRDYLRKLAELPDQAVARFNAEAKTGTKDSPTRSVRAKE